MDIGDWLRQLGLERYEQAFRDNAIDLEVLPELSDADLEQLGLLLGHRRKLQKATAELRPGAPGAPASLAETAVASPPATEAERRQLTVMFAIWSARRRCAARLDPEDMREVIRAYQNAVRRRDRPLRGPRRQVHGRRRAGLFRLSAGARGRGRARRAGGAGDSPRRGRRAEDPQRRGARAHGSASRPGSWWSATWSARVQRRSRRWSARRPTSRHGCRRSRSRVAW